MPLRKQLMPLVVLVFTASASMAPAQTTLRYQFKAGETLPYVMEQKMKTAMSIMGKDIETKMNITLEMFLNVVEVKDRAAQVQFKVTHAKMFLQGVSPEGGPTGPVKLNSKDKDEPKDPMAKVSRQVIKAVGTMEMNGTMLPTGALKDFKVSEKTIRAMKDLPDTDKVDELVGPKYFQNMISNLVFPPDAVATGKTWTNKIEAQIPFYKGITENTYTYEGPIKKNGTTLEKIALKLITKFEIDPNAQGKIKDSKGSGQILFDNHKGRIIENTIQQTTEIQNAQLNATMEQTTTFRLRKE